MADWFLPAGTPGSPDEWCFQTIPTAEVKVYTDYWAYYERLADLFAQAKKNDEIFLVGWGFELDVLLKNKKSALFFLEAARGRGANVRLLATASHSVDNAAEVRKAVAKKIDALIDDQLPAPPPGDIILSHQKAVFIKLESNTHLFLGGMDVALYRLDAWFDVQVEVVGQGAILGRKTLEERWQSVRPGLGGASAAPTSVVPSGKAASYQVQFVRTYPPFPTDRTNWKRTYAEKGDHTNYALLSRAIAKAEKTIYLEEQMLWATAPAPTRTNPPGGSNPKERSDVPDMPDTLEQLLRNAVGRGVKLVIIAPPDTRPVRGAVVKALSSATNPPVLLQPHPDMLFVHSKTWIFDDELVVIGSANYWDRSLHSVNIPAEAEFGGAFTTTVDGSSLGYVGVPFARALRISLWERIKQYVDPTYAFPRSASATFEDEVRELKSQVDGKDPFLPL